VIHQTVYDPYINARTQVPTEYCSKVGQVLKIVGGTILTVVCVTLFLWMAFLVG